MCCSRGLRRRSTAGFFPAADFFSGSGAGGGVGVRMAVALMAPLSFPSASCGADAVGASTSDGLGVWDFFVAITARIGAGGGALLTGRPREGRTAARPAQLSNLPAAGRHGAGAVAIRGSAPVA